ncbi:MAG: hypothetical protein RL472_2061, partial [Pseudomonadota bacterium]
TKGALLRFRPDEGHGGGKRGGKGRERGCHVPKEAQIGPNGKSWHRYVLKKKGGRPPPWFPVGDFTPRGYVRHIEGLKRVRFPLKLILSKSAFERMREVALFESIQT